MHYLATLALAGASAFVFWKLTRYFWLKKYYRLLGVRDVDVSTAYQLQQTAQRTILDVREPAEYDEAHAPGVVFIPLGQLARRAAELQHLKSEELLIICRGGVRSAKACLILGPLGFTNPVNIAGGMNDWKKQGLPHTGR